MDNPSTNQTFRPMRPPRKAPDLKGLQRSLAWAIKEFESVLSDPTSTREERFKAANGLLVAGGAYGKILERLEMGAEIEALKARMEAAGL
jgi:hypothetical protein